MPSCHCQFKSPNKRLMSLDLDPSVDPSVDTSVDPSVDIDLDPSVGPNIDHRVVRL